MSKRYIEGEDERGEEKKGRYGEGEEVSSTVAGRLNAPQAGGSTPGGTGSQVVATIIRNPRTKKVTQIFSKRFQFYTGGFTYELFSNKELFGSESHRLSILLGPDNKTLVTSIGALSPDFLGLYMTPIEYTNLPYWSYAKSMRIKITPLGYRLPFATNEATSTYANSQTIVQIASGVGLNTQMPVIEAGYNIADSSPTDVVTLKDVTLAEEYADLLYGNINATGEAALGACVGKPVNWNCYTSIPVFAADSVAEKHNLPLLTNFLNIQNINDCKGTPVIDYKYDTKNGLIKWRALAYPRRILARGTASQWIGLDTGFNSSIPTKRVDKGVDGNSANTSFEWTREPEAVLTAADYGQRIEKSHWMVRNDGQSITADRPPLLHFGVLPIESSPVLATTKKWAAVAAMWEIETELEVVVANDFIQGGSYIQCNKAYEPIQKLTYNFQKDFQTPTLYVENKFPMYQLDTTS